MQTRLLPQISLRSLLALMTVAPVLGVVGASAAGGQKWAQMMLLTLLLLVLIFVLQAVTFLVAWLIAVMRRKSAMIASVTPFAGEELPPQWVVPEDPQ